MGVELFFVVSAFSLCQAMPRHEADARPLLGFAIRRFFRIAPLFYALMIVILALNPWGQVYKTKEIAANVFFIFNFIDGWQPSIVPAGWTIGVEMPFYLLFPFLFRVTKDFWCSIIAVLSTLILAETYRLGIQASLSNWQNYMLYASVFKLPIFCFGIMAFYSVPFLSEVRNRWHVGIVFQLAAVIFFFAMQMGRTSIIDAYQWRGVMFCLLVIGFGLAPISFIVNRVTAYLGKISYSIYLLHIPIIMILMPVIRFIESSTQSKFVSYGGSASTVAAVTICLSHLCYEWFEEPINQFGRRFARRIAGNTITNTAAELPT
jgi:peptidoglycan/LPS O-acetylase OafA/YrhL